MSAKTSDRVSSIAARLVGVKAETLMALTAKQSTAEILANDIRTMAASLLRQDEVKGLRKLIEKVVGR
jgi:hypothetical protein